MSKHKNKEKKNKEKRPADDQVYQPDDKPIARARRWPEVNDLIAWRIFQYLQAVSLEEITPESIKGGIVEARNPQNFMELHAQFHEEYQEFKDEFLPVDFSPPYAD